MNCSSKIADPAKGEFWSLKYSEDPYEVRWPQKHKYHLSFRFPYFINISMYTFLRFIPIKNLMFILQTILFHTCSHLCLTNNLHTIFFGWFIWSISRNPKCFFYVYTCFDCCCIYNHYCLWCPHTFGINFICKSDLGWICFINKQMHF